MDWNNAAATAVVGACILLVLWCTLLILWAALLIRVSKPYLHKHDTPKKD